MTFRLSPQACRRLLQEADGLELSARARLRLKWFLFAAENENNIDLACRHFGIARTTFVRWAKRFDPRDPSSLEEESRRPHTVRQPETDRGVIKVIEQIRRTQPRIGKEKIRELLLKEHGIDLSSSTIGRVITRHKFFFGDVPSHAGKRREEGTPIAANEPHEGSEPSFLLLPGMTS